MKFKLIEAKDEKSREIITNLMQLYTYELSFYEDETTDFKLLDNGLYEMNKYFKLYWKEDKRYPYILKYNDEIAGFSLVRFNEDNYYEIGEFFILNRYRNMGAGTYMANEIFNKYHGKWEIRVLLKNKKARDFWRETIKNNNVNYTESLIRNNTRYGFYFEN